MGEHTRNRDLQTVRVARWLRERDERLRDYQRDTGQILGALVGQTVYEEEANKLLDLLDGIRKATKEGS